LSIRHALGRVTAIAAAAAGLPAALAAAGIGIAVMSGSGAASVTPHAHVVAQGTVVSSGPHPSGPTG